jgi:membrane-bound ClpP family serine protease
VIGKRLRAQKLPVKPGERNTDRKTVTALTPIDSRDGRIFVEGEYWTAICDTPIGKDAMAEIEAVQELTVKLRRKSH